MGKKYHNSQEQRGVLTFLERRIKTKALPTQNSSTSEQQGPNDGGQINPNPNDINVEILYGDDETNRDRVKPDTRKKQENDTPVINKQKSSSKETGQPSNQPPKGQDDDENKSRRAPTPTGPAEQEKPTNWKVVAIATIALAAALSVMFPGPGAMLGYAMIAAVAGYAVKKETGIGKTMDRVLGRGGNESLGREGGMDSLERQQYQGVIVNQQKDMKKQYEHMQTQADTIADLRKSLETMGAEIKKMTSAQKEVGKSKGNLEQENELNKDNLEKDDGKKNEIKQGRPRRE